MPVPEPSVARAPIDLIYQLRLLAARKARLAQSVSAILNERNQLMLESLWLFEAQAEQCRRDERLDSLLRACGFLPTSRGEDDQRPDVPGMADPQSGPTPGKESLH